MFFLNAATTKLILGQVSPLGGCHRGGPPSDATPPRPPTAVVYARGTAFPRVPHNLTTGAMRSRNADFPMVVKSVTLHDIERRNGRQRASSLR